MVLSWSRSCGQAHPFLGTQRGHRVANWGFPPVALQGLPGTRGHCPMPCPQAQVNTSERSLKLPSIFCAMRKQERTFVPLFHCRKSHLFSPFHALTAERTRWDPGGAWRVMHRVVLCSHLQPLWVLKPGCLLAMHSNTKQ